VLAIGQHAVEQGAGGLALRCGRDHGAEERDVADVDDRRADIESDRVMPSKWLARRASS